MWTTEAHTVAAGHSVTPASWQTRLEQLLGRVAGRFGRVEPRRHACALSLGCWPTCPERTAGRSPSTPARPPRRPAAPFWPARSGTTTGSATTSATSATTWSSTWPIPPRCWWWTRPATSRRAPAPSGATPGHRHRRQGRQRPGRRLPDLRHRGRAGRDRPRAVPAQGWIDDPALEGCRHPRTRSGSRASPSWPG
jgi:hypothetical protein